MDLVRLITKKLCLVLLLLLEREAFVSADDDAREGYAGGCYKDGEPICVSGPEDYCDEGTFLTAIDLRENRGHELRPCVPLLQDVVIGRCEPEGFCSNLASRCGSNSTFIEYDPKCTVTQDLLDPDFPIHTTYGKCGEDRCVWSQEDCLEGEEYTNNDPNCTSDQVEIGACFSGTAFESLRKWESGAFSPSSSLRDHLPHGDRRDHLPHCDRHLLPTPNIPMPMFPLTQRFLPPLQMALFFC